MVPHRGGMPGLCPAAALAGGVRLPAMRRDWGAVGNDAWGVSLPGMCWRDVADGRHDLRGDTQAVADVVHGYIVMSVLKSHLERGIGGAPNARDHTR